MDKITPYFTKGSLYFKLGDNETIFQKKNPSKFILSRSYTHQFESIMPKFIPNRLFVSHALLVFSLRFGAT